MTLSIVFWRFSEKMKYSKKCWKIVFLKFVKKSFWTGQIIKISIFCDFFNFLIFFIFGGPGSGYGLLLAAWCPFAEFLRRIHNKHRHIGQRFAWGSGGGSPLGRTTWIHFARGCSLLLLAIFRKHPAAPQNHPQKRPSAQPKNTENEKNKRFKNQKNSGSIEVTIFLLDNCGFWLVLKYCCWLFIFRFLFFVLFSVCFGPGRIPFYEGVRRGGSEPPRADY